jgi:hypothetical protein
MDYKNEIISCEEITRFRDGGSRVIRTMNVHGLEQYFYQDRAIGSANPKSFYGWTFHKGNAPTNGYQGGQVDPEKQEQLLFATAKFLNN